ncbi:MAG: YkgJ family cysteine cluster protein [Nitrospinota bacterium]|nr:YkgJ family cysteine cluster protein [Nitrospinota bacterium]
MWRRREGECVGCGECCKVFRMTCVLSEIIAQHGALEEAQAYYSFRGARFAQVDHQADRVSIEMSIPCRQLTADNKCQLHDAPEKKPLICHRYPTAPDDIAGCGYKFR